MTSPKKILDEQERADLLALLQRADGPTKATLAREMLNQLLSGN